MPHAMTAAKPKARLRVTLMKVLLALTRMAVFTVLTAAGAMVQLTTPLADLSAEAGPAYLNALAWNPLEGAVAGGLGHVLGALLLDYPLGEEVHLTLAAMFSVVVLITGLVGRFIGPISAIVIGVVMHGLMLPAVFLPQGLHMFFQLLLPMVLAAMANLLAAVLLWRIGLALRPLVAWLRRRG